MNPTILIVFLSILSAALVAPPARTQSATTVASIAHDADGYSGTDFWICFPQNAMRVDADGLQQMLYINSESRALGGIELGDAPRIPFGVESGSPTMIPIDSIFEIRSSGRIERKSIHVTSDRPVTVFAISRRASSAGKAANMLKQAEGRAESTFGDPSSESYAAIPTPQLGRDYMVLGYKTLFLRNGPSITSQAEIVATEDNTLVSAKLTASTKDGQPTGRTLSIAMNRGDVLQLQGAADAHKATVQDGGKAGDLTGTMVTASKPVAFFTGHQCAQAPDDDGF